MFNSVFTLVEVVTTPAAMRMSNNIQTPDTESNCK